MLKLTNTSISLTIPVAPEDARSRVLAGAVPRVVDKLGVSPISNALHAGKQARSQLHSHSTELQRLQIISQAR